MVKFFSIRDLRNTPGRLWAALKSRATVALTMHGTPRALVIEVEEGDLERALELTRRVRAELAVSRLREAARGRGLDRLPEAEVEAEVKAARAARRR